MIEATAQGLANGLATFGLSFICKIINNVFIVMLVFFLAKRKVALGNLLWGTILIALIELMPMALAYSFFPGNNMNEAIYCILFFPFPLVLFLYYPIYRYIFKAPIGMITMSLDCLLMFQYVLLLVYSLIDVLWAGLLDPHLYWNGFFLPDFLALVTSSLLAALFYWAVKKVASKTKSFFELPYNYEPEHMLKVIWTIFISSMSKYILLVCVRLVLMGESQYRLSFDLFAVAIGTLLIILQIHGLIDQYQKNRRIVIEWQAKQTERYIQSLLDSTTEFRHIKHDFYNVLQTYEGYISMADLDGLRKYHHSLVQTTVQAGTKLDMMEALRERVPIYTLLMIKKNLAEQYGVLFNVHQIGLLVQVSINDFDLCRILSNLLDNAIQAAKETEQKEVSLSAVKQGCMVIVTISNSTVGLVDSEQIFLDGYTTKHMHSGMGLGSVRSIIANYSNCHLRVQSQMNTLSILLYLESE